MEGQEEGQTEDPLMIPKALDHRSVKLMLDQGIDIAAKYREHFKVATVAPIIVRGDLDKAVHKLTVIKDRQEDQKWEKEIAALQSEVDSLQAKVDAAGDAGSVDMAPGASLDLAGRFNLLLAKHLDYMAKEVSSFSSAQEEVESQIDILRAKAALAFRNQQLLDKANEELKQTLEVKIATLGQNSDIHMAQAERTAAMLTVEQSIGEQITPQWKEANGLSSVPKRRYSCHCAFLAQARWSPFGLPCQSCAFSHGEPPQETASWRCWSRLSRGLGGLQPVDLRLSFDIHAWL